MTDVDDGLDLGRRIRARREELNRSLLSVAEAAGVSESFLSQVERGVSSPSIATLGRVARALGTSIAALFDSPPPRGNVVRAAERPRLSHPRREWEDFLLTPRTAEHIQIILSVIEPGSGSGSEAYSHDSDEECVIVLKGRMEFWVGDVRFKLNEGDSLLYESRAPHRNLNPGPAKAEVLWVITPPSY